MGNEHPKLNASRVLYKRRLFNLHDQTIVILEPIICAFSRPEVSVVPSSATTSLHSRISASTVEMLRSLLRRPIRDARRLPSIRANSTSYQAPEPPKSNPHRDFYRGPFRPIAFNVLISLATFQAIYWSWLKLESLEVKQNANTQLEALEGELEGLATAQADSSAKR
jgi:hypothetical protein